MFPRHTVVRQKIDFFFSFLMCSVPMPATFTVSFSHLLDCFICYIFYYSNNYLAPKMKKKKRQQTSRKTFWSLVIEFNRNCQRPECHRVVGTLTAVHVFLVLLNNLYFRGQCAVFVTFYFCLLYKSKFLSETVWHCHKNNRDCAIISTPVI